jgi:hypothetical protein
MLRHVRLKHRGEQLAEHPGIEQPRHLISDAIDAELLFRPHAARSKAAQRKLPLGIERVIEIEHDA